MNEFSGQSEKVAKFSRTVLNKSIFIELHINRPSVKLRLMLLPNSPANAAWFAAETYSLSLSIYIYILTLSLRWTIGISDKDLYWLQIEGLTNIYAAKHVRTKWHIYLINEIPYQRFSFLGINDVLVIGIKFVFFYVGLRNMCWKVIERPFFINTSTHTHIGKDI